MTGIAEGVEALRTVCPAVRVMPEGGISYIHLPKLKVWTSGEAVEMDALLCPQAHSGYATRLFLDRQVAGKGANWTVHHILGRTWHTWSWNNVPADRPLMETLANHLRALQ